MSRRCADCGATTAPDRRVCKDCSIEDRHGVPSDHFDADAGIVCWVQDLDENWHASMYFEGSKHVTACGEILETPVEGVKHDPRFFDQAHTCEDCEDALEDGEDDAAVDGGEFEPASELRADGGLEEVYRREMIVATDDGVAIGEDAVPEDDREIRTDGGTAVDGTELPYAFKWESAHGNEELLITDGSLKFWTDYGQIVSIVTWDPRSLETETKRERGGSR